jgi:sec-independent protein translocase protein TatA
MESLLLMGLPGGWEWIVIALVVVIFFGAKKIPEIARGMGKGIREFKDATKEIKKEIDDDHSEEKSTSKG